jgi:hypothetical protein
VYREPLGVVPNSPTMKRVPLGQIVGTDLFGNVVTVWVERDDEGTVLSRLSEGIRLTHVVENGRCSGKLH